VRNANLYHVLPRPDDKRWDGIEYFDPVSRQGAMYIFRPDNPENRQVVKLKGLNPKAKYWLWGEDSSVALQQASGDELMQQGLVVTLPQTFSSDIIFLREASLGKPEGLLPPDEFKLISAKPASEPFAITAELAWEPSKNARSYCVSVSDTADFAGSVASGTSATPSIMLSHLPPTRTLYWKVEAVSPAGTRSNAGGPGTFVTPESHFKGVTFASDLPWTKATAGAETAVHRDTTFTGRPLAINAKRYPKGLWTHAFNDSTPADIEFDISGKNYSTFKATVGLDDQGERGSVQFEVLVEGVKKAESPVILPKKTHEIVVDVRQVKRVTLRVLNSGDGYTCDHAVWGFARFIEAGVDDSLETRP
jgi:hypothetical protein